MSIDYQAAVTISANFQGQNAIKEAKKSFDDLARTLFGLPKGFDLLGGAAKALAGAFAVSKIKDFGAAIIDLGDSLNDLRQKTGIGVQALSDLRAAAEDGGVDFGSLEAALKKYSVNLSEANSKNKEAQAIFQALNVNSLKPSGELLLDIADRFASYEDGADKARLAVELFGRSGDSLIPVLNGGRAAIEGLGVSLGDDFAKRSDKFNDSINVVKRAMDTIGVDIIDNLYPALTNGVKFFGSTFVTVGVIIAQVVDVITSALNAAVGIVGELVFQLLKAGDAVTSFLTRDFEGAKRALDDMVSSAGNFGKNTAKGFGDFFDRIDTRIASTKKSFSQIFDESSGGSGGGKSKAPKLPDKSSDSAANKLKTQLEAFEKYYIAQQEIIALEYQNLDAVNFSTVALKEREVALKLNSDAVKATVGWEKQSKEAYMQATDEIIRQRIELIRLEEQQKRSFGQGAKEAFKEYIENANNTAAQTKAVFSAAFSGIEDAIVSFVKTGQLSFASLIDTIETMLIKIAVAKTLAAGFTALGAGPVGFANGGVMTSAGPVPLRSYAAGGVASSPQLSLFGEGSTPEAYVPLPDGRSIPVTMRGGSEGGNTTISVSVSIDNSGGSSESAQSDSPDGKQLGDIIARKIQEEIVKQQRPGGLLKR